MPTAGPVRITIRYIDSQSFVTVVGATTGCVPAPDGYLRAVKAICHKYGVLFCADEIMTGSESNNLVRRYFAKLLVSINDEVGRTGRMHAWQWEEGAQPDLQIVGKGLGGGYAPISAILIAKDIVDVFRSGSGAFNNGGF